MASQWGLGEPDAVLDATASYRGEMDILAPFLDECCVELPSASVTSSALRKSYQEWCDENGEKCLGSRRFANRLKERGYVPSKGTGGKRLWEGIGLKHE